MLFKVRSNKRVCCLALTCSFLLAITAVKSNATATSTNQRADSPLGANGSQQHYKASIYAIYDTQNFEGSIFTEEDISDARISYFRRVKASGAIEYGDIRFDLALDYHHQDRELQLDELSFSYRINKHMDFTLGRFKEPLGLENQLSLRFQPLLERSVPTNTMLFGRQNGVAFDIEHKHWGLGLAVTHQKASSSQLRDSVAQIIRLTCAPLKKKKKFIHLGFDFSSRRGTDEKYDIDEPLIAASVGNLLHSPNFAANRITLTGAEFASRYKKLLLQSEYFQQRIEQTGMSDQTIYGYYATAVWTFFGDSRTYSDGRLKFPGKQRHTLELAARFSHTDQTPIFRGDNAEVSTVSLNYFYKKHARVSAEYQSAHLTSNGKKNSSKLQGQSINMRLQLSY